MSIQVGTRTFKNAAELEKLVIHAAVQYDATGVAEDFDGVQITDPEYDDLLRTLKVEDPSSKAFKGASPSAAAESAAAGAKTIKHDPPLTSIDKADGTDEEKKARYDRFLKDCAAHLNCKPDAVALAQEYKHDGNCVRLNYVDGKFVSAGTRSKDGRFGTDITDHVRYLTGFFPELGLPLTLSLNGEVECHIADFALVNADQDAAGEEPYANPRNYTSGVLGRDDPAEAKGSRLRVTYHSITGLDGWEKHYKTVIERAKWANAADGLCLQDADGKGYFVRSMPHKFGQLAVMEDKAKNLPYYTDGIVLKLNDLTAYEDMGHQGDDPVKPPRAAVAWKFKEETVEAEVSRLEWNASRTGRIVPTALFDTPFVLADTTNSRATCNNYGWMEKQGLGPGAKVRCKKGGKIIPNIMEVITPVSDMGDPKSCPTCQSALVIETSGSGNKDLLCKNRDCPAKHIKGWVFYVQTVGGKGIGLSLMERILNMGLVKDLADLYSLDIDELVKGGLSERQATLAVATIYQVPPGKDKDNDKLKKTLAAARTKKCKIEAQKFFKGLGIPGAGETVGKTLIAHYGDLDSARTATAAELEAIAGIGPKTAASVVEWFAQNDKLYGRLEQHVELELPKKGKLTGKNFVLTGSFDLGKKHWEKLIGDQGGNVQSSVGSTTNYLVIQNGKTDGSPSDKEQKAAKYGTSVISVPDLEKLL
jgi:DNA ligase (NAD+)